MKVLVADKFEEAGLADSLPFQHDDAAVPRSAG